MLGLYVIFRVQNSWDWINCYFKLIGVLLGHNDRKALSARMLSRHQNCDTEEALKREMDYSIFFVLTTVVPEYLVPRYTKCTSRIFSK